MRIAVISDIHGNATALREVIRDIDDSAVDHTYCLGDNIGYGPEPEDVIHILLERNIPSVTGNHELALKDPDYLVWFNPAARQSLEKTMAGLSDRSRNYLASLPDYISAFNCRFVHGFPPDSPTSYLFEMASSDMVQILSEMTERICFIGHTHEPAILAYKEGGIERLPVGGERVFTLDPGLSYVVNAGSVGQPRDGSCPAKYVVYDRDSENIEIRHVAYDVSDTVRKIREAGFPGKHAMRLLCY